MARPRPVEGLIDVYGAPVHLATDLRQWRRLRREFGKVIEKDPRSAGATALVLDTEAPQTVPHMLVYLDLDSLEGHPSELLNTMAHEATHLAAMLLDHLGQPYDGQSEALAYLSAWACQWMWDTVAAL